MRTLATFIEAFRQLWGDDFVPALVGLASGLLLYGTVFFTASSKAGRRSTRSTSASRHSPPSAWHFTPTTEFSRAFTIVFILVGVDIIVAFASRVVDVMVTERSRKSCTPAVSRGATRRPMARGGGSGPRVGGQPDDSRFGDRSDRRTRGSSARAMARGRHDGPYISLSLLAVMLALPVSFGFEARREAAVEVFLTSVGLLAAHIAAFRLSTDSSMERSRRCMASCSSPNSSVARR